MNNWPSQKQKRIISHPNKTGHVCVCTAKNHYYKRASDWPKRTHVGSFLRPKTGGWFSHKISIQSALGLRSPFRRWTGFLHCKSGYNFAIDLTSLCTRCCFPVCTCVKARPIKWKQGNPPLSNFSGGPNWCRWTVQNSRMWPHYEGILCQTQ